MEGREERKESKTRFQSFKFQVSAFQVSAFQVRIGRLANTGETWDGLSTRV